eukprot:3490798-Pyramimonas_sp.AAC.1
MRNCTSTWKSDRSPPRGDCACQANAAPFPFGRIQNPTRSGTLAAAWARARPRACALGKHNDLLYWPAGEAAC